MPKTLSLGCLARTVAEERPLFAHAPVFHVAIAGLSVHLIFDFERAAEVDTIRRSRVRDTHRLLRLLRRSHRRDVLRLVPIDSCDNNRREYDTYPYVPGHSYFIFTPLNARPFFAIWSTKRPVLVLTFVQRLLRPLKTCARFFTSPLRPCPLGPFFAMPVLYPPPFASNCVIHPVRNRAHACAPEGLRRAISNGVHLPANPLLMETDESNS